jgi:hypothetical protein
MSPPSGPVFKSVGLKLQLAAYLRKLSLVSNGSMPGNRWRATS